MNLMEIFHFRKIEADIVQTKMMEGIFTDEQKIKLATIESLIEEIETPTTDEELDPTIATLTQIRDNSS